MTLRYVLVAVVAVALTVFALQNGAPTRVRFAVWEVDGVSLASVILLSAAIGVVLVGPALWIERWRLRRRVRDLEGRLAAAPPVEAPAGHPASGDTDRRAG